MSGSAGNQDTLKNDSPKAVIPFRRSKPEFPPSQMVHQCLGSKSQRSIYHFSAPFLDENSSQWTRHKHKSTPDFFSPSSCINTPGEKHSSILQVLQNEDIPPNMDDEMSFLRTEDKPGIYRQGFWYLFPWQLPRETSIVKFMLKRKGSTQGTEEATPGTELSGKNSEQLQLQMGFHSCFAATSFSIFTTSPAEGLINTTAGLRNNYPFFPRVSINILLLWLGLKRGLTYSRAQETLAEEMFVIFLLTPSSGINARRKTSLALPMHGQEQTFQHFHICQHPQTSDTNPHPVFSPMVYFLGTAKV